MFAFDADCADCRYCDLVNERKGKFYCEKRKDYVSARMRVSSCNYAAEVMGRGTSEKNRARAISRQNGYFIITAITDILGLDPENQYMNSFRYLKDVVLPNDKKYEDFLLAYESEGVELSNALEQDEERVEYAEYLLKVYLDRFVNCFILGSVEDAMETYEQMMIAMKKRYGMLVEYDNNDRKELMCE